MNKLEVFGLVNNKKLLGIRVIVNESIEGFYTSVGVYDLSADMFENYTLVRRNLTGYINCSLVNGLYVTKDEANENKSVKEILDYDIACFMCWDLALYDFMYIFDMKRISNIIENSFPYASVMTSVSDSGFDFECAGKIHKLRYRKGAYGLDGCNLIRYWNVDLNQLDEIYFINLLFTTMFGADHDMEGYKDIARALIYQICKTHQQEIRIVNCEGSYEFRIHYIFYEIQWNCGSHPELVNLDTHRRVDLYLHPSRSWAKLENEIINIL